ncbi:MAG TPA: hypothetical protein PLS49_05820 [Candidatus Woesebacteria bacterium]|nr:hypothetical protein [Candidatus Woesebacteria bacterium]
MNNNSKTLELYIENKAIDSSLLKKAISSFYDFVEEVTNNVSDKRNAIKWEVEVKEGSARFISTPNAEDYEYQNRIPYIYSAIQDGFNTLASEPHRPAAYSDFALERLRNFLTLQNYGLTYKVKIDSKELPQDSNMMVNINEILGYKEEAFGSIEGKLRTITAQRGLKVILYEDLTNRAIKCYIEDEMLKKAFEAFDKKVYVFGTLRYNIHGEPVSIAVKQIEPFKDPNAIPTFKSIYGILK